MGTVALDIRPVREADIPNAKQLIPADAAEPDWSHCYVVFEDNVILGIIGTEVRLSGLFVQLVAEPLYMARTGGAALVALGFLDGLMRGIAAANGLGGYGFSVRNINWRFQGFCEHRLPVKIVGTSGEAKQYWRAFT